ncbi:MAG: AAA family ATPase, partial [Clostridia bacterium]|nr:AAA family ATPase [Clostridia bacterium]
MLTRLKIENIAIIELADITFFDGFNVLTGETGAGKSIIIDSINAVTGERTSKELIRTGAPGGKVTAVFENPGKAAEEKLAEMGIDSDGMIVVTRAIKKEGKNICTINGTPCTVSMLKSVGTLLINIHGQHDSQSLLQSENHCAYIDAFGENEALLSRYGDCYAELLRMNAEINGVNTDEQQKARRIDMLRYQINELKSASITVGEYDSLKERHSFLKNAQTIIESLTSAYEALTGDGRGFDSLNDASYELESASALYDGISSVSERVAGAKYEIEDCAEDIRSLIESAECDPEELDRVEERIDFLRRMMSKYGSTEQDMLIFLDESEKELETITLSDEKIAQLKEKREILFKKAK